MKTAAVVSIGDELILGQTVDTNTAWLSRELAARGYDIVHHATVGDDRRAIAAAIRHAATLAELVLISGGLGPTEDDLSRHGLADAMGVELVVDAASLERIRGYFSAIKRPMPATNEVQAMFPRGARVVPNDNGTAPGIDADVRRGSDGGMARVFVTPGVPKEMKLMFGRYIAGHLDGGGAVVMSRTVHTFGAGESTVAQRLGALMDRSRSPSVGTTVSAGVVSLRLNVRAGSAAEGTRQLDETERLCCEALGDLVYGREAETLATVEAELLKKSGKTVATAESCTGGLLAMYLTEVSGASAYFTHGWVTYSDSAKRQLLGVSAETLEKHGAVSEAVVAEMAAAALRLAGSDVGLAISGVAGPTGGTEAKPVGTVCIALASQAGTEARTFLLPGDREMVRDRSAKMALTMLRFWLLGKRMPF